VAFTPIHQSDAELIIEAINAAKAVQSTASPAFHKRWMNGAENYYKGIVKGLARGKCWLCEEDAASWATRMKISISEKELERIRDAFLDAAHIVPNYNLGPMTPDNLRALCPNCHRVVDRLPNERREKLLRKK
jgi:5-methylcytosine-specific restriction endonuclease McrA